MEPAGVGLDLRGRTHVLKATPARPVGAADLAARLLRLLRPAGRREGPALRLRPPLLRPRHRRGARALPHRPSSPPRELDEPRTFLTVNAAVAATRRGGGAAGAARSCCRWWRCAPASRSPPQPLVEEAEKRRDGCREPRRTDRGDARALGDRRPGRVRAAEIAQLAATYDVDEVMVNPVAGAYTGPTRGRPRGSRRLRLLAA